MTPETTALARAIHDAKAFRGKGVPDGIGCGWQFASEANDEPLCPCPAEAAKVEAALAAQGYRVMQPPESDWARRQRYKAEAKAERAAEAERQMAAAVPYAGTIAGCQSAVHDVGRLATGFHRCGKAPKFVVRREERPRGTDSEGPFDGRLAVCLAHTRDPQSRRYHKHWSYERTADEPVEPEYQPTEVTA